MTSTLSGVPSPKRSIDGIDAAAQRIILNWPVGCRMIPLRFSAEHRDLKDAKDRPSLHVTA